MECLISVATGIVKKVGESLVAPIANQFGYLVYYNKNIKNLKNELKTLEGRKHGVQGMVDEDKRNGRQIVSVVEDWLYKVENIKNEVQEFNDFQVKNSKCHGKWSPYLVLRYSLSKRAKRLTVDVTSLNEEKFEIISYFAPPPRLGSIFSSVIKSFPSRKSIVIEVIEKLKDEDFKRVGICGMGGVGKTTFVKEIIQIPDVGKLFDEVVMAVVSQNVDYRKIQGQIADALGLKFDKETIQGRACQLHDRLKNINNVLIVLDDVWTDLDFESIGIPSNEHHKNCKILFTSRIEDVCYKMRSQKNFIISILSPNESWDLFNEMAGSNLSIKPDIHHIAKEVANECGGLPIAIVTMAKALANKEKHTWEDALDQLKKSSKTSLSEMQACVYSSIKLSYNFLDSEEDKIFLFLCCLFPEDFDIPIEVLLRHGMGLGLFKDIDALWKARNRVHTIIDRLKRRFMLLDSNVEECVKMHDVVRDVVISIASEEEYGFKVQCDASQMEQPKEETWCNSTAVSLMFEETKELPEVLDCPKLKLLQVASKKKELVQENFFQGVNKLMVLSLQNMHIHSMSSVFKALDNIHTLRLEDCQVRDISVIGKQLKKLEILSFANSNIKQLPEEIGQLSLLRLLDLTECNYLIQISANVLARLSRLEELYLRVRNLPSKETNHILFELQSLSHHLKVVEIAVLANEDLPKDLVFKNLVRFWVYVRDSFTLFHGIVRKGYLHPNILRLNNAYYNYIKKSVTIQPLLQKVEILNLVDIKNLKNVILELSERGFPILKHLSIEYCNTLEYVVDACDGCIFPQLQSFSLRNLDNLKEIVNVASHMSQTIDFAKVDTITSCQCFGSLTNLKIEYCNELKTVFTLFPRTIILATLQRLHVAESYGIEYVISSKTKYDENSMIEFSNLVELRLQELPNLIGFAKTNVMHERHSTVVQIHDSSFDEFMPISTLFKSNWMQLFPKLEKLFLHACSLLEMVFDMQESKFHGESLAFLFAQLKEIEISWLSKLRHIWGNVPSYTQGFQNLKSIKVKKCDCLRHVLTPNIARALTQLQKMVIHSCHSMEQIVGKEVNLDDDDEEEEEEQNVEAPIFGQLESLTLFDLPSLVSICSDSYETVWPSLTILRIEGCPRLKTFATCTSMVARQENFNASSSYSTTCDVANSTSKKDSPRFLQCCLGCTPHAFSNLKAKASSTEKGVRSVSNIYTKEEIGSPVPILEQTQVKGWDSLEVLFLLEQNQHSDTSINCLVKLIIAQVPTSPVEVTAFNNLTLLSLDACHKLRYLFPYSIAKLLVKLQEIKMSNCKVVKQLVQGEGEDSSTLSLPQSNSPTEHENSSSSDHATFSQEARALEWPSLKRISITHCGVLEVVIGKEGKKIDTIASFAQLQSLTLSHLPNVVSFCFTPCASEPPSFENCHGISYQNHEGTSNEERRIMRLDPLINGFIFPNLTYLAITGCNKISCLFSPSTSTSFVRLIELDICGCRDIKEIVSTEETQRNVIKVVFRSLQCLKLENLSKLRAFCQGSYDFDFPSLHEVFVKNCHVMETFSHGPSYTPKLDRVTMEIGNITKNIWMGDLNATVPLCKALLAFQTSETLEWIKQDQCTLRYFTEEKHMTVEGFQRLLNLVPSNCMYIFQNLKELTIKNCGSLVEVFESRGVDVKKVQAMIHYKLESMNLYSLPKLIHVWKNHGGILGFQKLRILRVEHCGNLCSLFSPTIARSLVQLWHLRVHSCHIMEEITTKEDEETEGSNNATIVFPLLNKLELRYVPNLKCFCSGTFNIDLPSCEEMIIEKCPKMTTFCYGSVTTAKLLHIYKGSYEYVDIIGDLNMTIYHANESLKVALQTSETITCIEHDQHLLPYLRSDTELVIEGNEKLLNCIPSNMLHRFQHLRQLKVHDCGSLVEIFESEGVDENGDEGYTKTPYNYDLQEMHMYDLPKLMHIWKNDGGILGFMNLKKLKIQCCHSLKSVLSPSMARSLSQLQELSVHECEMVEEIITREEEKVSEEPNQVKITFPALQWLTLYRLPSLRCFCSSTYHFELPSCHDIIIIKCPEMEACHGTIGTSELPFVSMKTNYFRAGERS
ncbi:disease resistance protein [Spatholobus suberectus]|nr:disease resistance protein [Spatholobus suberectus]